MSKAVASDALDDLKAELERFGATYDADAANRSRRMLNITRDTGEFLAVMVLATAARRVLEIGTSNGYSTLWLAEAVLRLGGRVVTVESSAEKAALAAAGFARSGLADCIEQLHEDAGQALARSADVAYDLVFLDSERALYPGWWPELRRVLRPGGLLIVDNATSHPHEVAPFAALVRADPAFATCLLPVGKGEFLATRERD
jgi:predicted O-methyltransferase YrrM